jgi:NADH-quinone oxidoreductase subunit J
MTATEGFVYFFTGLSVFATLAVLFSRRLISGAFSLGLLLLAIAGIYGSLHLEAALLAQLVLYIGGIMVLIGFALQLYPESPAPPALRSVRDSLGKGLILLGIMLACLWFAPWEAVSSWENQQKSSEIIPGNLSLKAIGQQLILHFPLEFEWLGVLMLAGLMVAGWYLKEFLHPNQHEQS